MVETRGILHGVRIVDCTIITAGPMATMHLGDLGAEVLKIEEPGKGDPTRGAINLLGVPLVLPHGRHVIIEQQDRNKKSVTIDLHKEKGQEVLHELVNKSDVFVTNLLPQACSRFKIDYETLSKVNPRIIWAGGTVFGPKGPDKDSPGLDRVTQARSGLMMVSGDEGMPPIVNCTGLCDHIFAVMTAYGVLAALVAREKYGIGQEVILSQLGATMNTIESTLLTTHLGVGKTMDRQVRKQSLNPMLNLYQCQDSKWIMLHMHRANIDWSGFCEQMGLPELKNEPKYETMEKRIENRDELIPILKQAFMRKTSQEWDTIFRQWGKAIYGLVQGLSDLENDPQVIANDYILTIDHPILGKLRQPGFPVTFSKTPPTFRTIAPELGQHTEEVLIEILGYSWDKMAKLRDEGVI